MQRTLLFLTVAASYLLFAGAPSWTLGPLLGLAFLSFVAAPRRSLGVDARFRWLDIALVALALAIVVQLAPLPPAMTNALSPHAARVRTAMLFAPLADATAWAPLSIDRRATVRALGHLVLGILTFWAARGVFSHGSTRQFCRALALFAATMAILAVVQKAATPRLLLFLQAPEARSASPYGAFVNRNHFGGWLLLCAGPVWGYLIAQLRTHPVNGWWREVLRRFLASGALLTAMATMAIIGTLLATLSRSAVAGLGAAALAAWRMGRHRMAFDRTTIPTRVGLAGAAVLAVVFFVDIDGWAVRVQESLSPETGELSRTQIWGETAPVLRDFWLTGTGAGTFSDAMTQYQQARIWVGSMQRWAHVNNAHSHYLQVASEGGLLLIIPTLASLLLLFRLGVAAVRAEKGEMFWVRVGAGAGLAGMAVQSVWEISLVMPANAVLSGVLAALMLHERDRRGPSSAQAGEE